MKFPNCDYAGIEQRIVDRMRFIPMVKRAGVWHIDKEKIHAFYYGSADTAIRGADCSFTIVDEVSDLFYINEHGHRVEIGADGRATVVVGESIPIRPTPGTDPTLVFDMEPSR